MRLNVVKKMIPAALLAVGALTSCQQTVKMQDRIVSNKDDKDDKDDIKFTTNPKILVMDQFEMSHLSINDDRFPDIAHGDVVSKLIEEKLPNADVYKKNLAADIAEPWANYSLAEVVDSALTEVVNGDKKYDAINISLGFEMPYKALYWTVGPKITPETLVEKRDVIRDALKKSDKALDDIEKFSTISKILDKIETLTNQGTKVYVAAGNNGNESLNLLLLANGIEAVAAKDSTGSIKEYSADNALVNRVQNDEIPVEKVDGGYDITGDGKADFKRTNIAQWILSPRGASKKPLRGTSFAAPKALIEDFKDK